MRLRVVLVAVLAGATAVFGVGCTSTPPADDFQAQQQAQSLATAIFMFLSLALSQANSGQCPFPLGPSDPPALTGPISG